MFGKVTDRFVAVFHKSQIAKIYQHQHQKHQVYVCERENDLNIWVAICRTPYV